MRSQVRLLASSVLVGVVAGLAGIVFFCSTQAASHYIVGGVIGYRPEPHPAGEPPIPWLKPMSTPLRPWLWLVVPTIGGLLSGWLVYRFAPEAEGHGTDSVIAAYHQRQGYIRPRVPIVKIIASTLTLGTGGSGGREGPIAQIGAGFGSYLANLLRMTPTERRTLAAAGMGAGIAAIFRAPLAGALFAAEVLYRSPEFEAEVILPAALASVVSYCTFGSVFGWQPLFSITGELGFFSPIELIPYTLLGLTMVLLAMLYTRTFNATASLFRQSSLRPTFRPALGAFLAGAVGLSTFYAFHGNPRALAVMSFGYDAIQEALNDRTVTTATILLAIALGKIVTNSLTIASGGSGGVFGPSMVIGGCGGGALGIMLHRFWPWAVPNPASYVVVGMAGFFAAAAKTPFSTLIIVSEMTGGYQLLLPALWVCVLSFMLSDEQSIYSSQVEGRSRSPAHTGYFIRQAIAGVDVSHLIDSRPFVTTVYAGDRIATVIERFDAADLPVLPVVDEANRLRGVIDLDEAYLALSLRDIENSLLAADLMRENVAVLTPKDDLQQAMEIFSASDLLALPVVNDRNELSVVAVVKRSTVATAYLRRVSDLRGASA